MKLADLFLVVFSLILLSCNSSQKHYNEDDYIAIVKQTQEAVDSAISKVYSDIALACQNILDKNFEEETIRTELKGILSKNPALMDACFVSNNNIITYVEPPAFKFVEGQDIANQEHQLKMIQTKKPVMSSIFKVLEGQSAIVLATPILKNDEFLGSINIVVKPSEFIPFYTQKIIKNPDNKNLRIDDFAVADTSGNLLYDIDSTQTGRNIFTDTIYLSYKEMLDVCHIIMTTDSGKSHYTYLDKTKQKNVTKDIWWRSSNYHNYIWKFSVAKERD